MLIMNCLLILPESGEYSSQSRRENLLRFGIEDDRGFVRQARCHLSLRRSLRTFSLSRIGAFKSGRDAWHVGENYHYRQRRSGLENVFVLFAYCRFVEFDVYGHQIWRRCFT